MFAQIQLGRIDTIVICGYLLGVIGLSVFREKGKPADLSSVASERTSTWPKVCLYMFSAQLGPGALIAACGAGYSFGIVNANYRWLGWPFLIALAFVFLPVYFRLGIKTLPEFIRMRFGSQCGMGVTYVSLVQLVLLRLSMGLFVGSSLLSQLTTWPYGVSVTVLGLGCLLFTLSGGLDLVIRASAMQSLLLLIVSGVLAWMTLAALNSWQDLRGASPVQVPAPYTWKLFHPAGAPIPWYAFLLGYPVLAIGFWCADQVIIQGTFRAKNIQEARKAIQCLGFLQLLPPLLFMVPGIAATVLQPGIKDDKDVLLTLVAHYLPVGWTGLMVAMLLSIIFTGLCSGLTAFSAIYTREIYQKRIRPAATAEEIKRAGGWAMGAAVGLALTFVTGLQGIENTSFFELGQSILAYLTPTTSVLFLMGVCWKNATPKSAWMTLVIGTLGSLGIGFCDVFDVFADEQGHDIWPHFLINAFILFVSLAFFMTLLSLITQDDSNAAAGLFSPPDGMQDTDRDKVGWWLLAGCMVTLYLVSQVL